jgi:hypothetical protein
MEFWLSYLPQSAEAIRNKLQNLNHVNWRQFFPKAGQQGGLDIACIVDNTMLAFCRPGQVETAKVEQ